jgi:pilus assembly protein CpaB
MPIRNIATLVIAVVLGVLSVILVRSYLAVSGRTSGTQTVTVGTVPVVVAAQAIARDVVVQPGFLKVVNFPSDSVPAGAFQSISQFTDTRQGQRVALRSIVANEPILPDEISEPGGKPTLAIEISDGMRAVSLRANDVAGVGGFIVPGDRVDVMLTRTVGNQPNNSITQVLADNVVVLGVDQSSDEEANKPVVARAITVEVTPAQAQAISLGQSIGSLSLALRHASDEASLTKRSTDVQDLSVTPTRRPAAAQTAVRVVRGVSISFDREGEIAPPPLDVAKNGTGTAGQALGGGNGP